MDREVVEDRVVAIEAVVASSKEGGVQGSRSGRPGGGGVTGGVTLMQWSSGAHYSERAKGPRTIVLQRGEAPSPPQVKGVVVLVIGQLAGRPHGPWAHVAGHRQHAAALLRRRALQGCREKDDVIGLPC